MGDITSANVVFMISVPLILPVPQQLQGFGADDIFDTDAVEATSTMMGVDGKLSGGMVFVPKPMSVTLQADSPSIGFFDAWYQAQQAAMSAYAAQGNVTFPSLGTTFAMLTGYLKNYKYMPDAKKLLQPRKFTIEWESVVGSPVGLAG